ncbi:hypothetical protein [Paenibacillus ginsengarvi]|uniref:hypothetical protein n=1 Tax=Paenibacillus ginsengarvi TaxID=400777 RepID=UPI001315A4C2|nr:hypothetical protein [Paenibacillus ginsengarvi]
MSSWPNAERLRCSRNCSYEVTGMFKDISPNFRGYNPQHAAIIDDILRYVAAAD